MDDAFQVVLPGNQNLWKGRIDFIVEKVVAILRRRYLFAIFIFFVLGKLLYLACYVCLLKMNLIGHDLFSNLCHWDCGWYQTIIHNGYDLVAYPLDGGATSGQANWAFFPLFPLTARVLISVFNTNLSVIIFNQALFFVSMILLYKYTALQYSKQIALVTVFILGLSGINIYILSFYTESLFLFLTTLSIYLIAKEKYYWAALVCCLLTATRVQGVVILLPLVVSYSRSQSQKLFSPSSVLLSILALSGLGFYMLYLQIHVNDFLAFYHIQSAWNRNGQSWFHPFKVFLNFRWGTLVDCIFGLGSFLMLYYFYYEKKYNEMLFLGGCLFLTIVSQSFGSYARFFLASYGSYIFFASYSMLSWRYFTFISIGCIVLNIIFTLLWLLGVMPA